MTEEPDTCYYCGEELDPDDPDAPCSENDDKPHESQQEFNRLVNAANAERQRQLDALSDKMRTHTKFGEQL